VQALSAKDVKGITRSFYRPVDKIAVLFAKLVDNVDDNEIQTTLELSANAYSTLRSRLRSKVQNYLIAQADSPKADVLSKLLNIEDIIFTEQPTIALTTLKKLEQELIRFDLSNELTIVYKHLKKLHLNSADYFHYSQLYNRHVAYSLALDKAEDILAKYFREYGLYYTMGDASKKLELTVLYEEMSNVCALYQSHRMFVYFAALQIFHCLFVDESAFDRYKLKPVEDIMAEVEETFAMYPKDGIYAHLKLLFEYIKFEYYLKHEIYTKARLILNEINNKIPSLLIHYENYSFPAQVLVGKLMLKLAGLIDDDPHPDLNLFSNFKIKHCSTPAKVIYYVFRALTCYDAKDYARASKWLFELNNEVSFKENNILQLEVKCLITYIKYVQKDERLSSQSLTSAQRILRIIGAEKVPHLAIFVKMLAILNSDRKRDKVAKLNHQLDLLYAFQPIKFQPTLLIKIDRKALLKTVN